MPRMFFLAPGDIFFFTKIVYRNFDYKSKLVMLEWREGYILNLLKFKFLNT